MTHVYQCEVDRCTDEAELIDNASGTAVCLMCWAELIGSGEVEDPENYRVIAEEFGNAT